MLRPLLLCLLLLATAASSAAQNLPTPRSLSVSGEALIWMPPDTARIVLTAEATADSLRNAFKALDERVERIRSAVQTEDPSATISPRTDNIAQGPGSRDRQR